MSATSFHYHGQCWQNKPRDHNLCISADMNITPSRTGHLKNFKMKEKNLILHINHCHLNDFPAQTITLMETQSRIQTSFKYMRLIPSALPSHQKRNADIWNDSWGKSRILPNSSLCCDKLILVSRILFPMQIAFKRSRRMHVLARLLGMCGEWHALTQARISK